MLNELGDVLVADYGDGDDAAGADRLVGLSGEPVSDALWRGELPQRLKPGLWWLVMSGMRDGPA